MPRKANMLLQASLICLLAAPALAGNGQVVVKLNANPNNLPQVQNQVPQGGGSGGGGGAGAALADDPIAGGLPGGLPGLDRDALEEQARALAEMQGARDAALLKELDGLRLMDVEAGLEDSLATDLGGDDDGIPADALGGDDGGFETPEGFRDPMAGVPGNRDKGPKGMPNLRPGGPRDTTGIAGQQDGSSDRTVRVVERSAGRHHYRSELRADGTRTDTHTEKGPDGSVTITTEGRDSEGELTGRNVFERAPDGSSTNELTEALPNGNRQVTETHRDEDGEIVHEWTMEVAGGIDEMPRDDASGGAGICLGGCRPIAALDRDGGTRVNPEQPDDMPRAERLSVDSEGLATNPDPEAQQGGRLPRATTAQEIKDRFTR